MKSKYLVWNFIGIAVGLMLIFIGYQAWKKGIGPLEVTVYNRQVAGSPIQSHKYIQDPFSLGVIIIGLNLVIIFYKILTKGQK
jgi:hypothetical protein